MNDSPSDVVAKTGVMSALSQVMSGIGFVAMLFGAVLLVFALISEFSGDDGPFEFGEVATAAGLLINGLLLAGIGQIVKAFRSIAINCAVIAAK
jgi:hypothetical protein